MRCRSSIIPWYCVHKIFQIPMNCRCKLLLAFLTAQEMFVTSFPFPEKFLLCTDKTESIEWQGLVPRLRTGDCFEIHLPHWGLCDLLLSSHQTFCSRYCFASASSARSPYHLGSQAVSVFWEMSINTVEISVNSSNHSARSRNRSIESFLAGFREQFPGASWAWWCICWCTWRVLRWRCRWWTRQSRNNHWYEMFRFATCFFPCLVNRGCLPLGHS